MEYINKEFKCKICKIGHLEEYNQIVFIKFYSCSYCNARFKDKKTKND